MVIILPLSAAPKIAQKKKPLQVGLKIYSVIGYSCVLLSGYAQS